MCMLRCLPIPHKNLEGTLVVFLPSVYTLPKTPCVDSGLSKPLQMTLCCNVATYMAVSSRGGVAAYLHYSL